MLCISAEMTSNSTLTLFTDERRLYLVLSIAAAHAAQCFLQKNKTPSKQWYYRSTIKMHASSPVATALFFIPSLCAKHNMDFAQATLSGLP